MKISIEITCDDELSALKAHLSVVREQLIRAYTKDSSAETISLEDETYQGSYIIRLAKDNNPKATLTAEQK